MVVRRLTNNSELYHHGIKGQSWGVKNGPPYPLNAKGKALAKQQRLMKKHDEKVASRISAAKKSNEINKKHTGSTRDYMRYDAKKVNQYYLDNVNKKRINAEHKYYDYKMRMAAGDKSVKEDYKKVKKYLKKAEGYDSSVNTGSGLGIDDNAKASSALREAYNDQKKVQRAHELVRKTVEKYGDMSLGEGKKAVKATTKITNSIEKANKILADVDGSRITSYKKTYGEKNSTFIKAG